VLRVQIFQIIFILFMSIVARAGEQQVTASVGLWGYYPLIATDSYTGPETDIFIGYGYAVDYKYLFGQQKGPLLGIGYDNATFGYHQGLLRF
jgi:hypothetical protein